MSAITIIDYGMGNLRSVQKAIEKVGSQAIITSDPSQIAKAERVILPGVGAFRDAINALHQQDLVGAINDAVNSGKPFLGICLGLQLLFELSYEDGEYEGLGIIPGRVQAQGKFVGERLACLSEPFRLFQCFGSDDDSSQPDFFDGHANTVFAANSSTHLAGNSRFKNDTFYDFVINGFAGFCSIQVDKVQPFGSLILPSQSHFEGIISKDSLVVVVALTKANTFSTTDIDCWIKLHLKKQIIL